MSTRATLRSQPGLLAPCYVFDPWPRGSDGVWKVGDLEIRKSRIPSILFIRIDIRHAQNIGSALISRKNKHSLPFVVLWVTIVCHGQKSTAIDL